jgi:glycine/serine hydroxymethyltransferase
MAGIRGGAISLQTSVQLACEFALKSLTELKFKCIFKVACGGARNQKETLMLIASGILTPDEVSRLNQFLVQSEVSNHFQIENYPGGIKIFVDSAEAAERFRASMHVGVLGNSGWGTKLRVY